MLRCRSINRWRTWALSAGLFGVLLVVVSIAVLMVFGSAGQRASNGLTMVNLVWPPIAPILAAALPSPTQRWERPLLHLAAGLLLTVTLVAGFLGAELFISPGS